MLSSIQRLAKIVMLNSVPLQAIRTLSRLIIPPTIASQYSTLAVPCSPPDILSRFDPSGRRACVPTDMQLAVLTTPTAFTRKLTELLPPAWADIIQGPVDQLLFVALLVRSTTLPSPLLY